MLVMLGFATFNHWDVFVLKQQSYVLYSEKQRNLPLITSGSCACPFAPSLTLWRKNLGRKSIVQLECRVVAHCVVVKSTIV
jgi:hypothetical protein